MNKEVRLNHNIKVPTVRLIGVNGEQVGVVAIREAVAAAQEAGLDLVEISPNAQPPVCKIMDYSKFLYEQKKKKAASKGKQIHIKEVKLRPGTEEADYQVKLRSIVKFIEHGDKVKITIRFRGREITHQELGRRMMDRILDDLKDVCSIEQTAKMEGRQIVMVLMPKKG